MINNAPNPPKIIVGVDIPLTGIGWFVATGLGVGVEVELEAEFGTGVAVGFGVGVGEGVEFICDPETVKVPGVLATRTLTPSFNPAAIVWGKNAIW